jgi:hypothetical protein
VSALHLKIYGAIRIQKIVRGFLLRRKLRKDLAKILTEFGQEELLLSRKDIIKERAV